MVARALLLVKGGDAGGTTVPLSEGTTTLGRAPLNDIVVDEPGVSRQHAGIRAERDGFWIQDLGSRNGTFVNGQLIEGEGQRLRDMDLIELGGVQSHVQWVFRESGATVQFRRPSF